MAGCQKHGSLLADVKVNVLTMGGADQEFSVTLHAVSYVAKLRSYGLWAKTAQTERPT